MIATVVGQRRAVAADSRAKDAAQLLRLLGDGGCPVCRYRNTGVDYWFRAYIAETHTEPQVRLRVTASLGLCPAHTRYLILHESGPWLLKSMYADVVRAGQERLSGQDRSAIAGCPVCEHAREDERIALDLLARTLDGSRRARREHDPTAVRDTYRAAGGACVLHALAAMRSLGPSQGRSWPGPCSSPCRPPRVGAPRTPWPARRQTRPPGRGYVPAWPRPCSPRTRPPRAGRCWTGSAPTSPAAAARCVWRASARSGVSCVGRPAPRLMAAPESTRWRSALGI